MKKYNIPVSWIQQGLLTTTAENLKDAVSQVEKLDLAPLNLVGQTAPNSTRVAYSIIHSYVPVEKLTDEITLFSSSRIKDCPFCEAARKWLGDNNLTFKEVDVAINQEEGHRIFSRSGNMNMPQLEIGNEIVIGFTEPEVKAVCQKYGFLEGGAPDNAPPVTLTPDAAPAAVEKPKPEKDDKPKAKVVKLDADKVTTE